MEALRLGASVKGFWLAGFCLNALAIGMLMATTSARSVSAVGDMFTGMLGSLGGYGYYGSADYFSLSFGQWLGIAAVGFILAFVAFVLRSLTLKWTFSLRRAPQTFGTASGILATAYVGHTVALSALFVLLLIPSGIVTSFALLLLSVVALPLTLVSEILIYVGLNRTVRFAKSPLIPHAVFTGVWLVLTAIAYAILFGVFAESLIS